MDVKVIIVLAGVLLLGVGLFLEYDFSGSSGSIKEFLSDDSSETRTKENIENSIANGSAIYKSAEITTESVEKIKIPGGGGSVKVGGTALKTEELIEVTGFAGTITLEEDISLAGVAKEVKVGDVIFEEPSIQAINLPDNSTEISDITSGSFSLHVESGRIIVNDRISIVLEDDVVEILEFTGDLGFMEGNTINLDGRVKRLSVSGEYELVFTS